MEKDKRGMVICYWSFFTIFHLLFVIGDSSAFILKAQRTEEKITNDKSPMTNDKCPLTVVNR